MPLWGFPLQTDSTKFKLFNLLSLTHKMFKVSKYKEKTKFGSTKKGIPTQTGLPKFKLFLLLTLVT